VSTVLRGHDGATAGTNPCVPATGYGLATTEVDDLVTVLDATGIRCADFVAHSTGGAIAVAFALRHPERTRRLALLEPTLLSILDGPIRARVEDDFQPVIAAADRGDHTAAVRALLDVTGASVWAELPEEVRQKVVDRRRPMARLAGPHVRALLAYDVTAEQITALAPPTFVVYGAASIWFEAYIAARLRELRPDIEQLHVDGAGHMSHVERADVVGPAVAAFLTTR
jgi:pimeloyl-ACP methyl ester carboxylesterase